MMASVTLSWFEIIAAANVGVCKRVAALKAGRKVEEGRTDGVFGGDVIGAIGECAFAKWLGVYWAPALGVLDTNTGDVAGVQVKATALATGSCVVRKHDPDGRPYVLVLLHELPVAHIAGWIMGADARDPRYFRERDMSKGIRGPGHYVPQRALSTSRDELELVRATLDEPVIDVAAVI